LTQIDIKSKNDEIFLFFVALIGGCLIVARRNFDVVVIFLFYFV